MQDFNIQILPNGNLELSWGDKESLQYILDRAYHKDHDVLAELLDGYRANDQYWPVVPGSGTSYSGPFVGLTDAPCITDQLYEDEDGFSIVEGTLWAYTQYEIKSFAEEMVRYGRVVFTKIGD